MWGKANEIQLMEGNGILRDSLGASSTRIFSCRARQLQALLAPKRPSCKKTSTIYRVYPHHHPHLHNINSCIVTSNSLPRYMPISPFYHLTSLSSIPTTKQTKLSPKLQGKKSVRRPLSEPRRDVVLSPSRIERDTSRFTVCD
jgi:hypothetical protein